jgi:hypothetical protein
MVRAVEQSQRGKRVLGATAEGEGTAKRARRSVAPEREIQGATVDHHTAREESLDRREMELERLERAVGEKASAVIMLEQELKVGPIAVAVRRDI